MGFQYSVVQLTWLIKKENKWGIGNYVTSTIHVATSWLSHASCQSVNVNGLAVYYCNENRCKMSSSVFRGKNALKEVLGLFQKLSSGGWATFFFSDPSTPRTHMESEPPRPSGHVSALINPCRLWIKYALTPRTRQPLPTPRICCQQNTLPPQNKKVPAAHPPTPRG